MRTPRILAALVLSLSCALGAAACVQETDASTEMPQETSANEATATVADALEESDHAPEETTAEASNSLGYESPSPGPGVVLPGGHDPGGPGAGWGRGFADDPSYAPYFAHHDPDPYKEQRHAKQREYDRIAAENRRHGGGVPGNGVVHRHYPGGTQEAPAAPAKGGPLNPTGRCEEACYANLEVDFAKCRKVPKDKRQACWTQAMETCALCIRDCGRNPGG